MEFFNKAKAVRLKSHLDKYLIADDDEETVRQSRNGSSKKARWIVEFVEGNSHLIRLKSSYNDKYLTASDEPFLLGMTGKKVLQTIPSTKRDSSIEWEPIKEGYKVKLRARSSGKFLRANGSTPPWRNTVTHDQPNKTVTQDWLLWDVDVVDISPFESIEYIENNNTCGSSLSSLPDDSSAVSSHSNLSMTKTSKNHCSSSFISKNYKILRSFHRSSNDMSTRESPKQSQGVSGMEFFDKAKLVRLHSHHGKYLVADDDEETVRQSRNGSSQRARWTVEFVEGKNQVIRLKSCHGLYLTATSEAFLLGMTGKKVLQTLPSTKSEPCIEWEPIKEGFNVKLRTNEGKYLRANGSTPPWRNSITHDVPHRTATQDWVLWGVDVVDIIAVNDSDESVASGGGGDLSPDSSFNSLPDDYSASPDTAGSSSVNSETSNDQKNSERSANSSVKLSSGMEFFKKATTIKLKSHHDKYLTADSDQETVVQERHGTANNAKWIVEFVDEFEHVLRLKSCYGKYLTAIDEELLLGVTGRKVLQTLPRKLDSSVQWEPIRDGFQVRLKTRYGNYLRANGGLPPWRNSITHDIPHRHTDWILWHVEVIETRAELPKKVLRSDSLDEDLSSSSFNLRTPGFTPLVTSDASYDSPKKKSEGRIVYYKVVDEEGNVNDEVEESSFQFKGQWVEELTQKLKEETGLENITVCLTNKLDGQLYPLRLALPPNNATMHIVVVPSTSKVAGNFLPKTPTT